MDINRLLSDEEIQHIYRKRGLTALPNSVDDAVAKAQRALTKSQYEGYISKEDCLNCLIRSEVEPAKDAEIAELKKEIKAGAYMIADMHDKYQTVAEAVKNERERIINLLKREDYYAAAECITDISPSL